MVCSGEWHSPLSEELRNKEVVLSSVEEERVGEGHRGKMKIRVSKENL